MDLMCGSLGAVVLVLGPSMIVTLRFSSSLLPPPPAAPAPADPDGDGAPCFSSLMRSFAAYLHGKIDHTIPCTHGEGKKTRDNKTMVDSMVA